MPDAVGPDLAPGLDVELDGDAGRRRARAQGMAVDDAAETGAASASTEPGLELEGREAMDAAAGAGAGADTIAGAGGARAAASMPTQAPRSGTPFGRRRGGGRRGRRPGRRRGRRLRRQRAGGRQVVVIEGGRRRRRRGGRDEEIVRIAQLRPHQYTPTPAINAAASTPGSHARRSDAAARGRVARRCAARSEMSCMRASMDCGQAGAARRRGGAGRLGLRPQAQPLRVAVERLRPRRGVQRQDRRRWPAGKRARSPAGCARPAAGRRPAPCARSRRAGACRR